MCQFKPRARGTLILSWKYCLKISFQAQINRIPVTSAGLHGITLGHGGCSWSWPWCPSKCFPCFLRFLAKRWYSRPVKVAVNLNQLRAQYCCAQLIFVLEQLHEIWHWPYIDFNCRLIKKDSCTLRGKEFQNIYLKSQRESRMNPLKVLPKGNTPSDK